MGKIRYRRIYFGLLALPAYALTRIAARYPRAVESLYSRKLYAALRESIARVTGILPFSAAELLLALAILTVSGYLFYELYSAIKHAGQRKKHLARLLSTSLCISGVLYSSFVLLCGLNYYRLSFTEYSGLEVQPVSAGELKALCTDLAGKVNLARISITNQGNIPMQSTFPSPYQTALYAPTAYRNAAKLYPALGGYTPRPKPVLASVVMSYLNISGVYFPFTMEGNVNVHITSYNIPFTMAHELAHFKGFMREDEANFIAYLVCTNSGNPEYEYSGLMLAYLYASDALYSADREAYWEVSRLLSNGVKRDLQDNSDYWRRFETPVGEAATAVNNAYLKVNGQQSGVKSYGKMVDLLVADYNKRQG